MKVKKSEDDINFFDISDKQKCFVIKVKDKFKNSWPQENGGSFFSYLKNFKDIKNVDLYPDSLDLEKEKLEFAKFMIYDLIQKMSEID